MADCARQVIADNKFADRITLIPKRSTEIEVGPGEIFFYCKRIFATFR